MRKVTAWMRLNSNGIREWSLNSKNAEKQDASLDPRTAE